MQGIFHHWWWMIYFSQSLWLIPTKARSKTLRIRNRIILFDSFSNPLDIYFPKYPKKWEHFFSPNLIRRCENTSLYEKRYILKCEVRDRGFHNWLEFWIRRPFHFSFLLFFNIDSKTKTSMKIKNKNKNKQLVSNVFLYICWNISVKWNLTSSRNKKVKHHMSEEKTHSWT